MGEARRRRDAEADIVWHHTSTLRTNQIWMSGQLRVEGQMDPVYHPELGELRTDAFQRRAMTDFPPVLWFTRRLEIPRVLVATAYLFVDKETGAQRGRIDLDADISNAITLHRLALGFRRSDIAVTPWPDHPGWSTPEGAELNETARDAGDDPRDWFVSETPVDVLAACDVRVSKRIFKPKLERIPSYLGEIKRMVRMCRETEGVFIPPAWVKPDQVAQIARRMGVGVVVPKPLARSS